MDSNSKDMLIIVLAVLLSISTWLNYADWRDRSDYERSLPEVSALQDNNAELQQEVEYLEYEYESLEDTIQTEYIHIDDLCYDYYIYDYC